MDGMPLYEYARSGTPLPRPIERREVTVHSLELTHWLPGTEHSYSFPEKKLTDEERQKMTKAMRGVEIPMDAEIKDEPEQTVVAKSKEGPNAQGVSTPPEEERPPAFVISMRVSGGTYVRSLAHDIGHAVDSAAHVVTLTRSRQGRFALPPDAVTTTPFLQREGEPSDEAAGDDRLCIPWDVFTRALHSGSTEEADADGWREWERLVIDSMEVVEAKADT